MATEHPGGSHALSDQLDLIEKLRHQSHHADCRRAADEIERLRADAARMDWLATGTNYVLCEESLYPTDGTKLRAFVDWCMAGNEPADFEA